MPGFLLKALAAGFGRFSQILFESEGAEAFGAPGFLFLFLGQGFPGLEGVVQVFGIAGFLFGFGVELVTRHVAVHAVELVLLFEGYGAGSLAPSLEFAFEPVVDGFEVGGAGGVDGPGAGGGEWVGGEEGGGRGEALEAHCWEGQTEEVEFEG